jgi:hypothetical protein
MVMPINPLSRNCRAAVGLSEQIARARAQHFASANTGRLERGICAETLKNIAYRRQMTSGFPHFSPLRSAYDHLFAIFREPARACRGCIRSGKHLQADLVIISGIGHRSTVGPNSHARAHLCSGDPPTPLLLRLVEITQIGRRLVLVGRHQLPIGRVKNVSLIADLDPNVVLRAGL